MSKHLRANLWLLGSTVFLCCVVYFPVVWAIGRAFFPRQADWSLVTGPGGKVVGSRLIAQPFLGDEYFHPRPSAVSFNAMASGGSNLGPSNPSLRDRVARQLGPIVRYSGGVAPGRWVQRDIEAWFKSRSDVVAAWADHYPGAARSWVVADDKHKAAVLEWQARHPEAVADWKKANPEAVEPAPPDLAVPFFRANAERFQRAWPELSADPSWSLPAVFFDLWLQEHPDADLEPVPGDLVTTSGSGLDPHITLKNARYQLDRVAGAWAEKTGRDRDSIRREIEGLLVEKQEAPLGGLVGVPLVNVLEINLALADRMRRPAKTVVSR
jgi:K+-transporting ATPase ATPase C chain